MIGQNKLRQGAIACPEPLKIQTNSRKQLLTRESSRDSDGGVATVLLSLFASLGAGISTAAFVAGSTIRIRLLARFGSAGGCGIVDWLLLAKSAAVIRPVTCRSGTPASLTGYLGGSAGPRPVWVLVGGIWDTAGVCEALTAAFWVAYGGNVPPIMQTKKSPSANLKVGLNQPTNPLCFV